MIKPFMLRNRKGLFYLLLVSILVGVFIIIFLAYKEYSFTDRQKVVETRIRSINDFIRSIDSDSERVIYISGFRAMIAMEDHVARSGRYLSNTQEAFRMAFYNGTVNGTSVEVLVNATYSDYLNKLRAIANRIGIDIDINVTNITLRQASPWDINVNITAIVNITDQRGVANWNFHRTYNTTVSILNIRDPLYSVATLGKVPNTIRFNESLSDDYVDINNDTTNLMIFVNNSYYTTSVSAPSFLMRLEGNFSPDPYGFGIESFVNIEELIYQGVDYSNSKSVVDYILFSNMTGYENVSCVKETPWWFKIDSNHTAQYEVEELLEFCI